MFVVPEHVWRTTDGRLVEAGHAGAAFLAYPAGTELSAEQAKRVGVGEFFASRRKSEPKSADKAMPAPQNKGVTPIDPELTALRTQATELGVRVDGRWSADRLRQEITSHPKESL